MQWFRDFLLLKWAVSNIYPGFLLIFQEFADKPDLERRELDFVSIKVSVRSSQAAHQAGAYPGFRSMKGLGVFLLSPGWDASPSQGSPQQ